MSESNPKPQYSPGLDGIIAGESAICSVQAETGLHYYGYGIEAIANQIPFEQVAWLLLHGEMPTAPELKEFSRQLATSAALPDDDPPAEYPSFRGLITGPSALV